MSELVWLVVAAIAAAGAYLFGSRARGDVRRRQVLDEQEERYRAWRGRASRPRDAGPATAPASRHDLALAVGLGLASVAALLAFLLLGGR